jgi:hypothetical protein
MKPQRLLGIVFLAAAAIVLFLATDVSSLSDQVRRVFAGNFTDRTTWLFAGGIAAALLGSFLVLGSARVRRA